MNAVREFYERILVPTLLYDSEALAYMSIINNRVRNKVLQNLCGVEKNKNNSVEKRALKWHGHVARMDDAKGVKIVKQNELLRNRLRERARHKWPDCVR